MIIVERGVRANHDNARVTSLVHVEDHQSGEDSVTRCGRLMPARTLRGDLMTESVSSLADVTCETCRKRSGSGFSA